MSSQSEKINPPCICDHILQNPNDDIEATTASKQTKYKNKIHKKPATPYLGEGGKTVLPPLLSSWPRSSLHCPLRYFTVLPNPTLAVVA